MEESISLSELLGVLKRHLTILILVPILVALISGIGTVLFVTPEYEVSTQFLVNQRESEQMNTIQSSDIRTNLELINTYNDIIKSNRILESVKSDLALDFSVNRLMQMISVNNANQSQVVTVKVRDIDPYRAESIANKTVSVFQDEILVLLNVDNVNTLTPATVGENPQPVSPNLVLNIAIGAVLGLMVTVGMIFLIEYLDTTIKTEEDIETLLDIPVIGTVSHIDETEWRKEDQTSNQKRRKTRKRGAM